MRAVTDPESHRNKAPLPAFAPADLPAPSTFLSSDLSAEALATVEAICFVNKALVQCTRSRTTHATRNSQSEPLP